MRAPAPTGQQSRSSSSFLPASYRRIIASRAHQIITIPGRGPRAAALLGPRIRLGLRYAAIVVVALASRSLRRVAPARRVRGRLDLRQIRLLLRRLADIDRLEGEWLVAFEPQRDRDRFGSLAWNAELRRRGLASVDVVDVDPRPRWRRAHADLGLIGDRRRRRVAAVRGARARRASAVRTRTR